MLLPMLSLRVLRRFGYVIVHNLGLMRVNFSFIACLECISCGLCADALA